MEVTREPFQKWILQYENAVGRNNVDLDVWNAPTPLNDVHDFNDR